MQAYADSTLTSTTDSARIALREGTVTNEGGAARWAATRLDGAGAAFTPVEGARNSFTWTVEQADHWTATLTWRDHAGQSHVATYPMERVGR